MGLNHSPGIVTNGLAYYYDMGNPQKSWKGAPTTNLYADGNFALGVTHPVNGGGAVIADPTGQSRNVIRFLPSAGNQYHGRDITAVVSTVYSLQMEVYVSADFNGTNVQMYPEQGGAGAAVAYNLSNKGTWQTLKFNGKAATTTNIRMLAYVLSSFTTGFVLATNIQVEQNAFATPFVNTTRSTTQALIDLTNNTTLTATSLTYASDGTFSYNGSGNYVDCGTGGALTLGNNGPFTASAWVRVSTLKNFSGVIGKVQSDRGGVYSFMCCVHNDGTLAFYNNAAWYYSTNAGITTNTWYNVVFSFNGSVMSYYVNGVARGTSTLTWPETTAHKVFVGSWYSVNTLYDFNGTIATAQLYNRALSEAEVQQNFNAHRGRYGV